MVDEIYYWDRGGGPGSEQTLLIVNVPAKSAVYTKVRFNADLLKQKRHPFQRDEYTVQGLTPKDIAALELGRGALSGRYAEEEDSGIGGDTMITIRLTTAAKREEKTFYSGVPSAFESYAVEAKRLIARCEREGTHRELKD